MKIHLRVGDEHVLGWQCHTQHPWHSAPCCHGWSPLGRRHAGKDIAREPELVRFNHFSSPLRFSARKRVDPNKSINTIQSSTCQLWILQCIIITCTHTLVADTVYLIDIVYFLNLNLTHFNAFTALHTSAPECGKLLCPGKKKVLWYSNILYHYTTCILGGKGIYAT